MEATTEKSTSQYDCPVCFDYLLPPIYQCPNGHTVCHRCEGKLRTCPVCRENLPKDQKIRCLVLEGIVVKLSFNCRNREQGCLLRTGYSDLEGHLLDCQFMKLSICSHIGIKCEMAQTSETFLEHISNTHTDISGVNLDDIDLDLGVGSASQAWQERFAQEVIEINQCVSISKLNQLGQQPLWLPNYFQLNGHLFFLATKYEANDKSVTWSAFIVDKKDVADKYVVNITLLPLYSKTHFVKWQGGVRALKNELVTKLLKEDSPPSQAGNFGGDFTKFKISIAQLEQLSKGPTEGSFDSDADNLSWRLYVCLKKLTDASICFDEPANHSLDSVASYEDNSTLMAHVQANALPYQRAHAVLTRFIQERRRQQQ